MRESLGGAHDRHGSSSPVCYRRRDGDSGLRAGPTPKSAADMKATDFETAIGRPEASDPQSPEALNVRLDYADFLSEPAASDCQQRLAAAQAQLDAVAAQPAHNILLRMAPARMAGNEYKIHLARATCIGSPPLKSELQQALAAAQLAVTLYRDALDNASAVVMQFNVAALYRELGDMDHANSALQSAIAMDRDYGFRDDAEDDTRLLLAWQGKSATESDVAALMKDFPARTADFKFHWSDIDADVAVRSRHQPDSGQDRAQSGLGGAETSYPRQCRGLDGIQRTWREYLWAGRLAGRHRQVAMDTMYFMARALLQTPAIDIGKDGDFKSVGTPEAFGTNLAAKVAANIGHICPAAMPSLRMRPCVI